jgi:N-formylglutamate amidohydrolase
MADTEAIAQDQSLDANADGIPDSCQLLEGLTFFGRNDYVSYQTGSLPIILVAPHGGTLEPAEIPQREGASAPRDANTIELAEAISDAFYDSLGRRPHLITCHLHRYRLDCNRTLEVGAEDNAYAQQAWSEFHAFIDQAKANATTVFGQALVLDLHGMSRTTIEIGTLIRGSQWLESDTRLSNGGFATSSSVRHMATKSSSSFANLSRGAWSLGANLESAGYPAIPSPGNPDPGTDSDGDALDYFRGGYNTVRHGSLNGGTVDALQIEHPYSIRENTQTRADYAQALVASLTEFLADNSDLEMEAELGVRLEAVDNRLSETGNTGLLRVHRTGALDDDVEVRLEATGAAAMANDFKWEEKHVLPSNQATLDIEIFPLDDLEREGPEAFTIRLKDKSGVSPLGEAAEFWIADNEAPSVWVEYLIPNLGEGWESTLLIARDYCDDTASAALIYSGEADADDFLYERPEDALFEDQESTLKLTLRPEIDERFEGLQDLIIQVEGEENVSAPSSRWQGWIEDDDIPQNLLGWWDFAHPTDPLLDRVSHQEALRFPTDSPPLLETDTSESTSHWLELDGEQDVIVLTEFPAQGPNNLSIGFSFRAEADADDGYQYLWSHNDVGDRSSLNIYLTPDGWLRTGFRAENDDWNYRLLDIETDYRDGEWHDYRFHVDWSSIRTQVYIDGQLRADGDLGAGAFTPEGHVFLGGRSDLNSGRHFRGDLARILFAVGE